MAAPWTKPVKSSNRLIEELRGMSEGDFIPDAAFRRLLLTAMADLHERMVALEDKTHRDWTPTIVAVAVAVMTVAAAWLRP